MLVRNRLVTAVGVTALFLNACEFETKPIFNPDGPGRGLAGLLDGGTLSQTDLDRIVSNPSLGPIADGLLPEMVTGAVSGADCDDETPCRAGLSCSESGECEADGETELGGSCVASIECATGQCVSRECVPAGDAELGGACLSSAECQAGLRCGVVGFSAQCIADGETDVGGECESSNECLSGLSCLQTGTEKTASCAAVPGAPAAVPALWDGVECEAASEGEVRAYFEIPGAPDAQEGDFFRLPFPNDVLTDGNGRVDVSGFPTPGVNPIVGVDPIQPYVDAVKGTMGWGTDATATFRFSGEIDFAEFDKTGAVHWLDITDPAKPIDSGISYRAYSGNTNYVCHNVFSVRRPAGFPMEPGHTYVVWLGATGRDKKGREIRQSENFAALLEETAPTDPVLAAAHEKYAPLRAYLAAAELSQADVLVATVITVGPTRDLMSDLAAAVRKAPVPAYSAWTNCAVDSSPCPQAEGSRACGHSDAFDEYHLLIDLPVFQQGEAPYLEEGGKITRTAPVRTEAVCASLTIPKGATMPQAGWPAVVFTHGTGGSFRSHITGGMAEQYAEAATPAGMVNFAVLGFDQVQHGPRRGESTESPDNLFFNFLNPDAAQGNPLQGAADVISVGRFISGLNLTAAESGGDATLIDSSRVVFFGHSQGSMHGSLGLPFASEYQAAVLSGNGASLSNAMLTKTAPVDIAGAVPLVVNDGVRIDFEKQTVNGSLPGGIHHPVLTLIQQYIDPADPLNFARQISREPLQGQTAKHVFQTYGLGDHFSPPLTMEIYARAAKFSVVRAHSSAAEPDDIGQEVEEFPLTMSFGIAEDRFTTGVRQYGPPKGKDGHFVVFNVASATSEAAQFLGMAASGVTPQIGE